MFTKLVATISEETFLRDSLYLQLLAELDAFNGFKTSVEGWLEPKRGTCSAVRDQVCRRLVSCVALYIVTEVSAQFLPSFLAVEDLTSQEGLNRPEEQRVSDVSENAGVEQGLA